MNGKSRYINKFYNTFPKEIQRRRKKNKGSFACLITIHPFPFISNSSTNYDFFRSFKLLHTFELI